MIYNILYWFLIEYYSNIIIDKKYIDYINPFLHGSLLSIYSIKELIYNNNLTANFNQEQLQILNLSKAYFIYDLIKMALIKNIEIIYI